MAANGAAEAEALAVPECVDKALAGIVDQHGWKKPRIHIESGSKDGDGYLSNLYRVVIQNEDDSIHLMCKTTMPAMEKAPFIQHVFKVEGFMYNRVLPAMEEIAHLQRPLPWPRGYPNELQPPCLVMEDLGPSGFVIGKRGTVVDDSRARQFVTQIARFHGAGMALDKLRPDFIAEFRAAVENIEIQNDLKEKFAVLSKSSANTPEMIKDRFPEGSAVYELLKARVATLHTDFFESMGPDPEGGNAIVHGDCHINNMMFQLDKSGVAQGCRLIDFQTVRYSMPTNDLILVLLCMTEKPTRDAHWQDWMRQYHGELQATLRAAGIEDPDAVYSWDRFQAHLRRAAPLAMCFVPMMVHAFTEDQAIKEIQEAIHAMATEDVPELMQQNSPMHIVPTPTLKRRFGDVLENLVEWGLLPL